MASEYEGKRDGDKTIPLLPRPLRKVKDRIRALNLTGDATGAAPRDDMMFWQGLDKQRHTAILSNEISRYERDRAIDEMWG